MVVKGASSMQEGNVGDTIFYKLRLSDLPKNPEGVWKGKIEGVSSGFVLVSSLDAGYEGLREAVWPAQIVKIERNVHDEGI
jgi:hypothetical protein